MSDHDLQPGGRVFVVIPTYNRKGMLTRCLQSLLQQSYPLTKIYIIDNASSDGTRHHVKAQGLLHDSRVVYLRMTENFGSAGAYYAAIGRALAGGADWVWIVDDDSEALPSTLERLLTSHQAHDPSTVAVCPTIVDQSGAIWSRTRGHFNIPGRRWRHEKSGRLVPLHTSDYDGGPQRIDWGFALGLLIRADAIRKVGLPKREFFFGNTDTEYTLRLSRAGALWLIPSSVFVDTGDRTIKATKRRRQLCRLLHIPRQTTPIESYWRDVLAYRNYAWLMKRYAGEPLARHFLRLISIAAVTAICDDHPLLRVRWFTALSLEGRVGYFRRMTPQLWHEIIR